jgi:hypothetical protein
MIAALRPLVLPVALMTAIVVAANVSVQHPVQLFGLQDHLTWGAVIYPISFLITDLTNRRYGVSTARRVVIVGFVIAVALSIWLATPRIAMASGTAFLVGQMLDVTVFNRLRRMSWWRAPLAASLVGSVIDTALFFSLAFAGVEAMSVAVPSLFGLIPLWANLAIWDGVVKIVVALLALVPYGALLGLVRPVEAARA